MKHILPLITQMVLYVKFKFLVLSSMD